MTFMFIKSGLIMKVRLHLLKEKVSNINKSGTSLIKKELQTIITQLETFSFIN
jgi:hypothetical protein